MDTTEPSLGPNKQIRIKTPKKNGRGTFNIYNRSQNFDKYAGLLNHPSRAMSLFNNQYYRQNQQPPLLPLPNVSAINHQQHPQLSRSLKKTKDMSLNPKKSKPTKREEAKKRSATQSISEFLIVASDNRWGPDPKDLPKHLLPVVLTSKVFEGSVFNLSPPPSSLPLPKFFLRSKHSCNAEAAADVDARATNNLRRLLRLR